MAVLSLPGRPLDFASVMTVAGNVQIARIAVSIPFPFMISRTTLSAGKYEIRPIGGSERVLAIRKINSPVHHLLIVTPCESSTAAPRTELVFRRLERDYTLSEVLIAGNNIIHQVTGAFDSSSLPKDPLNARTSAIRS